METDFEIYDVIKWKTNNFNIHVAYISRSKSNQTMKLGQLIEYNDRNISLQKSCRKWGRETSSRPPFVFWKVFCKLKAVITLVSIGNTMKENYLKFNFRLLIQRYAQFWFFRKGSGTSFSTTFCVRFFKKNISHAILY